MGTELDLKTVGCPAHVLSSERSCQTNAKGTLGTPTSVPPSCPPLHLLHPRPTHLVSHHRHLDSTRKLFSHRGSKHPAPDCVPLSAERRCHDWISLRDILPVNRISWVCVLTSGVGHPRFADDLSGMLLDWSRQVTAVLSWYQRTQSCPRSARLAAHLDSAVSANGGMPSLNRLRTALVIPVGAS